MIYVLLKGTSLWKALHLDKIPFEKLKNDYYFYGITGISFLLLIIQIFLNLTFDSIALSLLECLFTIGFSRYLYLFKVYQDEKELPEQEAQPLKEELSKEKASKKKSKKEVSE